MTDRLSSKRFLGFTDADKSPDEKTFGAFRAMLATHELIEPLFDIFHAALETKGMFARKGQMVDATFVEVPRQRNHSALNSWPKGSRGENARRRETPRAPEDSSQSGTCLRDHADVHEKGMEPMGWLDQKPAMISMTNLVYNMVRFEQMERLGLKNWRAA